MKKRTYICVDLKSFYASVECVERGLDPMTTNLVVADKSRTEKTICLAVSPSLKAYGISGRARLFEVVQRVKEVNAQRLRRAPGRQFTGSSWHDPELKASPELALDYIVAPPRMAHYIDWSTKIYNVYLRYIAPEDIFPYSIDEVFMDVTNYLDAYQLTARELAKRMILDVLETTGITATAGMGTNLYLAKVAMDIVSKHIKADKDGVRIAKLDEMTYRRLLWDHRPLTDFWRVGPGYAKKLEASGLYTMGDIARCSIGKPGDYYNEELLYKLFGVNTEILIDHAWGWEPCTIADVKACRPENKSIVSGQVLQCPYDFKKAQLVVREMADALSLDLVDKGLMTNQLVLTIGYDIENLSDPQRAKAYKGSVTTDRYGRKIPKHSTGTANLSRYSSSTNEIIHAALDLFDRIADKALLVRRLSISANRLLTEADVPKEPAAEQLDLFTDYATQEKQKEADRTALVRERKKQEAMLAIKKKYGKNAILKGMNLEDGATARERNKTIGGHKA
ncbi:DNA methylase [uncultured Dysosmobacter sp.]|uniref:Y-family DNA polymerase n=1 Tax=uncultured Dysosmobacter sp. TaxID=2591384 RepID=UPI002607B467|nr:DNA methylase [uncultured Dysosmobacter sp.]